MKKVIIAGASGLVGSKLLELLLENDNISGVLSLVRKPSGRSHEKLKELVVKFDELDLYREELQSDILFCCLGTTKNKTPDKKEYRKIDHDYPVKLSELASANGVKQYHFVSAMGADPNSRVFYSRLKGETEIDIQKQDFQSVHIYRPSLLTGNRKEKRPFEKFVIVLAQVIDPILIGSFRKYRSIRAETVAKTMLNQSLKQHEGVILYPSDIIEKLK